MWPASLLLSQQPHDDIARTHALDAFEAGESFEGFPVLVEDTGQGTGVFRIGEDQEQSGK